MDIEVLMERQTILQLALQEAFRKRDECQNDIIDLNNKLNIMIADSHSFDEKKKVVESMLYLKKCKDDWQETINHIKEWQNELKGCCSIE